MVFHREAVDRRTISTKDGTTDRGVELEVSLGSWRSRTAAAQAGARIGGGFDLFVSGDWFEERGCRDASPSRAFQGFGKLRWTDADSDRYRLAET